MAKPSSLTHSQSFIDGARRAQLIGCAIEVLAEKGQAHASLVQIPKPAGVSRGVVTYYFDDRASLFVAAVDHIYSLGSAFVRPAVEAAEDAGTALRKFVEKSIDFYVAHSLEMLALSEIRVSERQERLRSGPGRTAESNELAELVLLLERGQEDGSFRSFRTDLTALVLRRSLDAALERLVFGDDPESLKQELTTMFMHITESKDL